MPNSIYLGVVFNPDELHGHVHQTTVEDIAVDFNTDVGPTQAKGSSISTISMILEKPPVVFPPQSSLHSYIPAHISSAPDVGNNIPPLSAWQSLWSAWDLVTLRMIPSQMLLQKPIDLRHKCLFYIGHIPTFLDMLISKAINQPTPTEPAYFWDIFERGIDPSVDDPDHCHNHSLVPTTDADWPSLTTIIGFRDRVRERLGRLYDELDIGFTPPPFEVLARQWEVQWQNRSITTIEFGPTEVVLGMDDIDILEHTYGWDNESPARTVHVMPFRAEWRPVSCGEFERFWRDSNGKIALPASWILSSSGEISVRSLYGPVPLALAHTWPVQASYEALEAYARSKGGRIPNEAELRVILDYLNDDESFAYDGGANVGWRNWHPVCPTAGLTSPTLSSVSSPKDKSGKGHNGGIWEWTSTAFVSHEGFVGTSLFTGYSEDFWDGKHMVVLGGSYATLPRLTGRKTIRNFWQYNYPYAWVGARVVYDV
ncbi:C-type lectin protein [Rhodocollybia butyracea]|uniref:C-type lectin protein n=1 Tax=Rhodocollybia butyracea TaxID=206335 RepID=A0A9P5Q0X6_9AGAR|nr:C-type lectin protein [Rhodocollybia butyracea]